MTQVLPHKQLGRTQSVTREGFLLCQDVRIARCGTLLYGEHELEGLEGSAGLVRVTRKPEDVFKPESVASFAGKPVIVTHDAGLVTPDNWKTASIGVVLNPRRGDGADDSFLMGDLLIMDKQAIESIRATTEEKGRGPEVSAGYDADYEQTEPGFARQFNIFCNHVALVERGRAGASCSIGDAAMAVTPKPRKASVIAARRKLTLDKIRAAFATRDEEMLEEALGDVQPDPLGTEVPDATGEGDVGAAATGTTINVNINGAGGEAPTVDAVPDGQNAAPAGGGNPAPEAAGGDAAVPPWAQQLVDGFAALDARLSALEEAMGGGGQEEQLPDDTGGEEQPEAGGGEEEEQPTQDGKMTTDSAGVALMRKDVLARAELLVPGFKLPTLDSKASVKAQVNALHAVRRNVLAQALSDSNIAEVIAPVLAGKDVSKLTFDGLSLAFTAASELARAHNNRRNAQISFRPTVYGKPSKTLTPAEINAANRKLHGRA